MKNKPSKQNNLEIKKVKSIFYTISVLLGEILLIYFIFMTLYNPSSVGRFFKSFIIESTGTTCVLNDKEYNIGTDSNYDVECDECSKAMIKDIKENYIIYLDHEKNFDNMKKYFESNGGYCN